MVIGGAVQPAGLPSLGSAAGIAASGMNAAELRLGVAAHNIANVNTQGFRRLDVVTEEAAHGGVRAVVVAAAPALGGEPPPAGVDLGQETVDVIAARAAYAANARMLQRSREAERSLLDLLG